MKADTMQRLESIILIIFIGVISIWIFTVANSEPTPTFGGCEEQYVYEELGKGVFLADAVWYARVQCDQPDLRELNNP